MATTYFKKYHISKGKFKHYGECRGDNKPPTFQEQLKVAIDAVLTEAPPTSCAKGKFDCRYSKENIRGQGRGLRAMGESLQLEANGGGVAIFTGA